MPEKTFSPEILVIGAGPGGSAAAWGLATSDRDVLMVDQADFPRDKTCGDGLTPMALESLAQMGLREQVEAASGARVDSVRLIGPVGQTVTLSLGMLDQDYDYAVIIPRFILDDIVRQHALAAGARFQGGTRVVHVEREGDRVTRVTCTTPDGPLTIAPKQVVFAPGANIGMMAREGFVRQKNDLVRAARAYYTNVHIPANRFDFYLDARVMPGYGWIFPLGDGRANVGIGSMPSLWATKRPMPTLLKEFVEARAKEGLMRNSELDGPIKGFPLRIDFPAHRIAGANWVMVGEVTGLVNPVTGEGIDLALESALLAAEMMDRDITTGRADHMPYQRDLWEKFGPFYTGMRVLRDIVVSPFLADYVFWLMTQHDFLAHVTFKITQGLQAPQDVFHPLFIIEFFSPIAPRWALAQLRKLIQGGAIHHTAT